MTDYTGLLRELAVPRLAGTPNHTRVQGLLRQQLERRGFRVAPHPFAARPSRLLIGAPPLVRGVNLVAQRPGTAPRVWLSAHYDSKGQPISMAVRLAGATALIAGAVGLTFAPLAALALLAAGGVVAARNRATDESPGAVDNATGLVTVLAVVDRLPRDAPVGVVFPDAEEYGLLGARALAAGAPELFRDTAVVNLDGIDDRGGATAYVHRGGPLVTRVAAELGATGWRALPVLADGIPLGRVARECVTVLRGDLETMRLVHTPADAAERLTLAGAREVAEGVARALATA